MKKIQRTKVYQITHHGVVIDADWNFFLTKKAMIDQASKHIPPKGLDI